MNAYQETSGPTSTYQEPFHFPPDVFDLLVETVPRLCRSKYDVLMFFRGAGTAREILHGIENDLARDRSSYSKFAIVRTVLSYLNEAGDAAIRARREVIKRVVEFEDFTRCWPNERLAAEGLVAKVQRLVGQKDSFTRMKLERENERRRRLEIERAKDRKRKQFLEDLRGVREELFALFSETDAQARGTKLEDVLNRLFKLYGISIRESFRLRGVACGGVVEQIDGVIEFDNRIYLVEMKWWNKPLGVNEIAPHMMRIFARSGAEGLMISDSGFTKPAVEQCREHLTQKIVVLSSLHEIVKILYEESDLTAWLREKVNAAIADKNPFLDTAQRV